MIAACLTGTIWHVSLLLAILVMAVLLVLHSRTNRRVIRAINRLEKRLGEDEMITGAVLRSALLRDDDSV